VTALVFEEVIETLEDDAGGSPTRKSRKSLDKQKENN